MRAKLYKGPAHGKTYQVQPGSTEIVVDWVKKPRRKRGWQNLGYISTSTSPILGSGNSISVGPGQVYIAPANTNSAPPTIHQSLPRTGRGRYVKTQHTHPDGSVFFIYKGEA
jgi:hypothetical protein